MPDNQSKRINTNHEDIKKQQDEALKTPGYDDDPHIGTSNRGPHNEPEDLTDDDGDELEDGLERLIDDDDTFPDELDESKEKSEPA